ncbi:MAG TPA: UDP-3-O-(3-hydroxymyristoyl)glucosamine N-acyltransferase [Gemmatimonadales bacterium]|nr:UDP-3-O-(3-hydroxymyristoyl)glucosamine N-acyltransferase [Gemmatimonadales bacterium]
MSLPARAIADLVGGRLQGESVPLARVAALDRAGPDALSFLASPRYLAQFRASGAGAVLLTEALAAEPGGPAVRIVVADPMAALAVAVEALYPPSGPEPGIDSAARIGPGTMFGPGLRVGPGAVLGRGVRLGARCIVGPYAVLEDGVEAGDDVEIGPFVVCHAGARLGHRVRLKTGAVVGGEGFGFRSGPDGHRRTRHVGGCILEDDVEVGAHTCVDRGSVDDTVIGAGSKLDNLVHVAHNVRLGRHCLVMAQVGISGSTRLGDGVIVAGQAGIGGHLVVGDRVRVGGQAGVTASVPARGDVSGYPARPHREQLRRDAALSRLARIAGQLEDLAKERASRG